MRDEPKWLRVTIGILVVLVCVLLGVVVPVVFVTEESLAVRVWTAIAAGASFLLAFLLARGWPNER